MASAFKVLVKFVLVVVKKTAGYPLFFFFSEPVFLRKFCWYISPLSLYRDNEFDCLTF